MKTGRASHRFLALAATLVAWGITPGCEPSAPSDCNKWCECHPCTAGSLQACEERFQNQRDAAEASGCTDEHDEMLWCIDEASCGELYNPDALAAPNAYKCVPETNAFLSCL